ncbi:hypothetical protein [Nonlabens dokdonensis]|nr:hypothetical protein [Nonlabens dokdonensis]
MVIDFKLLNELCADTAVDRAVSPMEIGISIYAEKTFGVQERR